MIDFFFGIICGVIGVYIYDRHIMKRTSYKPTADPMRSDNKRSAVDRDGDKGSRK